MILLNMPWNISKIVFISIFLMQVCSQTYQGRSWPSVLIIWRATFGYVRLKTLWNIFFQTNQCNFHPHQCWTVWGRMFGQWSLPMRCLIPKGPKNHWVPGFFFKNKISEDQWFELTVVARNRIRVWLIEKTKMSTSLKETQRKMIEPKFNLCSMEKYCFV